MSLARAFTTKRTKRPEVSDSALGRSLTTRSYPKGSIRNKISGPVELISTTNMLSYDAPDLFPASTRSSSSGDDSDSAGTINSTPPTSPEGSSMGGSSPCSPEPNHLSCYFGASATEGDAPIIPKRALSHTKKSHEIVHRQRSISRMSSPHNSISASRNSGNMFGGSLENAAEPHPFGAELAQVSELAEEFGGSMLDDEEQELLSQGLYKFGADDYMNEIAGLFSAFIGESRQTVAPMWI